MAWSVVSPETLKLNPCHIHLVIKPIFKTSNILANFVEFEEDVLRLNNELYGLGTRGVGYECATLHRINRIGEYWPHYHALIRYSRGSAVWTTIAKLLRLRRYKYAWTIVKCPIAVSRYLQEARSRELLKPYEGLQGNPGREGMDDNGHLLEEELGGELSEHCIQSQSDTYSSGVESGTEPQQLSGTVHGDVRPPPRKKTKKVSNAEALEQAIESIQPPSVTEFKEWIVHRNYEETEDLREFLYDKEFDSIFARAHELVALKFKFISWEECLRIMNIDILLKTYLPIMQRPKYLSINESVRWIKEFLSFNNIDVRTFYVDLQQIVDRKIPKKNSLQLEGPPNSFKTVFSTSVAQSCIFYFNNNQLNGKTSQFGLQEAVHARMCFLDECSIDDSWKEKFLLLVGGAPTNTDKKYAAPQNISRTPVIYCYNKDPVSNLSPSSRSYYAEALRARGLHYKLRRFDKAAHCTGQLDPRAHWYILREFDLLHDNVPSESLRGDDDTAYPYGNIFSQENLGEDANLADESFNANVSTTDETVFGVTEPPRTPEQQMLEPITFSTPVCSSGVQVLTSPCLSPIGRCDEGIGDRSGQ